MVLCDGVDFVYGFFVCCGGMGGEFVVDVVDVLLCYFGYVWV